MTDAFRTIDTRFDGLDDVREITRGDVVDLLHLLTGRSIIERDRLHFRSIPAVNEFLRVSQMDPEDPLDMERLAEIHRSAVDYVMGTLGISLPPVLTNPRRTQKVFTYASEDSPHAGKACMLFKVMHVIQNLEARELLYHLPKSERELFARIESRVTKTVSRMIDQGYPVEEYQASQKTKDSLVTKLISKRSTTAAQVFDRIRFRLISSDRKGIIPVLLYLKKHLFPFNCVVPGLSANTLASLADLIRLTYDVELADLDDALTLDPNNEFTHRDYRVISFVVNIPLLVDDLIDRSGLPMLSKFGRVVLIPTEFQIFDRASYFLNESGKAAHHLYKSRQLTEVIRRLYNGSGEGQEPGS